MLGKLDGTTSQTLQEKNNMSQSWVWQCAPGSSALRLLRRLWEEEAQFRPHWVSSEFQASPNSTVEPFFFFLNLTPCQASMRLTARELFPLTSGLTFRGRARKRHCAKLTLQPFSVRRKQPCEICVSWGEMIISGSLLSDLSKGNTIPKPNSLWGFRVIINGTRCAPQGCLCLLTGTRQ